MTDAEKLVRRLIARGFNLNESAISHHQNSPNQSLESYVQQELKALNANLVNKHKVYLDTKYWILLRDVKLGRDTSSNSIAFSELLHRLVASGSFICPVSSSNLFELLRQQDLESRIATVQLMDKLSCGICLRSHFDRALDDFVRTILVVAGRETSDPRLDFDYISHILGFIPLTFDSSELVVASPLAYAKASYDMGRFTTLEDVQPGLDADNPNTLARLPNNAAWADEMNQYKATLRGRKFRETQVAEFNGGLDTSFPRLKAAMEKFYQIDFGRYPTAAESDLVTGRLETALQLFKHMFGAGKIRTTLLPQIHIQATIFAKVLIESTRQISRTDFDDVWHATDALPSCGIFFTENYLCHLLTHPPGNLANEFNATVASRLDEALEVLKKIT
jgi:hypothetical protein